MIAVLEYRRIAISQSEALRDRILHDEFSDYPEQSLYMIGNVEEAKYELI